MILPPKSNPAPKLKRISTDDWGRGLVTTAGRANTPRNGLWRADNCIVYQGGSIGSRASFSRGRIADLPDGEFVGPIFDYWNEWHQRFEIITVVGGILYLYDDENSEWVVVQVGAGSDPVTFDMVGLLSYARYGNVVCIADGNNAIAYYMMGTDDSDPAVVRPGDRVTVNPMLAISGGETEGDYRAYYLVSIVNDFGETVASNGVSANVALAEPNQPLGPWSTSLIIAVTGVDTALANNARVRIYRALSPDFIQPNPTVFQLVKEYLASDGDKSFTDNGEAVPRVISPQQENSTGGVVARYLHEIDGRLWAFGVNAERQRAFYSGTAGGEFGFPNFFGGEGGYFYVGYGLDSEPVTIRIGRADDGQICNVILCTGGRRFNVFQLSVDYGGQGVFHYYPQEQKGDEGAYSSFSVLDYMNSILYPSPIGFKSSGLRATYTNDNVTASIDTNIQDIVAQIPYDNFRTMFGTMYSGRAFWHINPSTILVFDARNNGAWTTWTIPHTWFGSFSVGEDREALYFVRGPRILRYADLAEFRKRDEGGPWFPTIIQSGRLQANPDDGRQWVRMLQALFVFSTLEGPIRLILRANSRRRLEVYTTEVTIDQDMFGGSHYQGAEPIDWSHKDAVQNRGEFASQSAWSSGPFIVSRNATSGLVEIRVRVNKDVNFIEWEIEGLAGLVALQLEAFVYEYVDIGVGLDFSSRYNEVRPIVVRG